MYAIKNYKSRPTRNGLSFRADLVCDGKVDGFVDDEGNGGGGWAYDLSHLPHQGIAVAADAAAVNVDTYVAMLVETHLNDRKRNHLICVGRPPFPFSAIMDETGQFVEDEVYECSAKVPVDVALAELRQGTDKDLFTWVKGTGWVKAA